MKTTRKLSSVVLSVSALLLSGQALAMNSAHNGTAAGNSAPQASHVQSAVQIKTIAPKRKMRIVREPVPTYSQATRTDTQSRFVIATDVSKDRMKVYKTVKHSKSMPNLFKN